jgi:4-alpha-glucanotransferase
VGDFNVLRRLAAWSASLGAGVLAVNPLHAPASPGEPSPYFAGSRIFLNPLYLALEGRPPPARRVRARRLIDREHIWKQKLAALEESYSLFREDRSFDAFVAERGELLRGFATWCALAEQQGPDWRSWPSRDRRPRADRRSERVRFHCWLQWNAERQLAQVTAELPLLIDLAVGIDPGGFDSWWWQDLVAHGVSVGAPPDSFNPSGQDWGLAAFDPFKLGAASCEPFSEAIRAAFRFAGGKGGATGSGGVRIDHVMGLFRLFWIPNGCEPSAGAYVRYPHRQLLDIVVSEAGRAGCFVVGEDLGTVQKAVRRGLARRRILPWKVSLFEESPPEAWPKLALASVSTHDLPTIAGAAGDMRSRLLAAIGCSDEASPEELIERAYRLLARAPCVIKLASLEDAAASTEQPNDPRFAGSRANWCLPLPVGLEELERRPLPAAIAAALDESTNLWPGCSCRGTGAG